MIAKLQTIVSHKTAGARRRPKRSERPTSGVVPSQASHTSLKQAMLTTRNISTVITAVTARPPSSAASSSPKVVVVFSGESSS